MKPRNNQWCSGCARQGHLEHECNYIHYHREYPPTRMDIVSYVDVLNESNNPRDVNARYISNNIRNPETTSDSSENRIPSLFDNLIDPSTINTFPVGKRMVYPNSLNSNIIIHTPNSPPNPYVSNNARECSPSSVIQEIKNKFESANIIQDMRKNFESSQVSIASHDIIQEMSQDFQHSRLPAADSNVENSNVVLKNNMKIVEKMFMKMPIKNIQRYLRKEMNELDKANDNPKHLRQKFFKFENVSEKLSKKKVQEKRTFFRRLNMYIFGVHHLNDGKLHVSFIRNFLTGKKFHNFDETKRRSLFNSYSYIFRPEKHRNTSYYRLIKLLVQKCDDVKSVKPL